MKKILILVAIICYYAFAYNMGNSADDNIEFVNCQTQETRLFNDENVNVLYCGITFTCYEKYNNGCRHVAIINFEIAEDNDYAFAIRPMVPINLVNEEIIAETDSFPIWGTYTEYHINDIILRKCAEYYKPNWSENKIEKKDTYDFFDIPMSSYCMSEFLPNDNKLNGKKLKKFTKHNLKNYINEINFKKFLRKK